MKTRQVRINSILGLTLSHTYDADGYPINLEQAYTPPGADRRIRGRDMVMLACLDMWHDYAGITAQPTMRDLFDLTVGYARAWEQWKPGLGVKVMGGEMPPDGTPEVAARRGRMCAWFRPRLATETYSDDE